MSIKQLCPILICDDPATCADFYIHRLGFQTSFQNEEYVGLEYTNGECRIELGLLRGCAKTPVYSGQGVIFGLEVEDVDAEYERLSAEGVTFVQSPQDNPWGDRSCICIDPAGMAVYLYLPIEPSEEYSSAFVDGK
ncbi:MAG: VOC family protein [Desulfovibrio sp.]|uniref:VOC family protein n=1 Tax=Desulfovibrio sp. 7SRBS1 TaxID=3378064 RepID=UPI003B40FC35